MSTLKKSLLSAGFAALALTAGLGAPTARADDTEVFFTPVSESDKPNILFILDSSATMGSYVGDTLEWSAGENWIEKADGIDGVSFSCDENKLYWTAGSLPIITQGDGKKTVDCSAMPYIDFDIANYDDPTKNKFVCKTALDLLRSNSSVGYVTQGLIAQYDRTAASANNYQWRRMQGLNNNGSVTLANTRPGWVTECLADDGNHGINNASTLGKHPNNKSTDGFGINTSTANNSVYSGAKGAFQGSFTFYTANRIGYEVVKANEGPSTSTTTRLEAVQAALQTMVESVSGVRIGLMRFDNNAGASRGGMVVQEMTDIESGKSRILDTLFTKEVCNKNDPNDCQLIFIPADKKSIGETLWEAYRYYAGQGVAFGLSTNLKPTIPFTSVPESMINAADSRPLYNSPVTECGKNYIVLLTDGLTEQDNSVDINGIAALPNFRFTPEVDGYGTSNAKCDVEDIKAGPTSSDCVDDLPAWMFRNDVNTSISGVQNVKTYTIGFDLGNTQLDLAARAVLRDAARRGGGEYYDATNQDTLEDIFDDIVRQILVDNASFTAPSVAVNAFNRTQNLNDLFMSVFKPTLSYRWLGNVKKYRLTPEGDIVDNSNPPKPAVDVSTGFFAIGTKSYWSDLIDGPDASLGGAASKLTDPAARNIYTNIDTSGALAVVESGTLSTPLSTLKGSDSATVTFANKILFNASTPADIPGDYPTNSQLIDWAYGIDVQDKIGTAGTTTDPRLDMGDPLHARPATVIYGGPADDPDTTLFATTNDGMLHAINAKTGVELWAFAPVELLPRLVDLYKDDGVGSRVYGLDGSVRVYKIDNDQDGVVDTGAGESDQVLLFFGMRRGGYHYYALDVTNRSAPKLLWRIGAADDPARGIGTITTASSEYLPGVGQTWSNPTITRMNIDRTWSSANPKKLVAVFGGGYDVSHDSKTSYADDTRGNRIYIVDAISGELIWRAGPSTDTGAQLKLSQMTSAIPGDVRSFDLTGDGFDDRMYAADLGGRVWRFDIANGATPANLVNGGVFASLGVADLGTRPDASNRKFFYAPDPSLVRYGGRSWINIAIGSGDRERPVSDTTVANRFYSLRDYNIFTTVPSDKYLSDCSAVTTGPCHQVITSTDSRLTDVTTDLNPTLQANSVGWYMNLTESGEKALAESRTFQNSVYFTTYTPRERAQTAECGLAVGVSKLFVVSAVNATPIFNYDASTDGPSSLSDRSKELAQGAIAPEVVFIFPTPDNQIPGQTPPAVPPVCLVGLESCGAGIANPPVRTYWRQRGAN